MESSPEKVRLPVRLNWVAVSLSVIVPLRSLFCAETLLEATVRAARIVVMNSIFFIEFVAELNLYFM